MFTSAFVYAAAFIGAIGILVTIHEFGHFWVARKMGVKVLRFSVGFGKPLFSKVSQVDGTEYVVAAIPLGGYVKMLDEREGSVDPDLLDQAFNRKSVWARIAIVAAGPIANLILAVFLYWVMFIAGVSGVKPLLSEPLPNTPAALVDIQEKDQVISVAGDTVSTWKSAHFAILHQLVEGGQDGFVLLKLRGGDGLEREVSLDVRGVNALADKADPVITLGLQPWRPRIDPIIAGVSDDGAAKEAGLLAGDRIVAVDEGGIDSWQKWVEVVRASPDKALKVEVLRGLEAMTFSVTPRRTEQGHGLIGAWQDQSKAIYEELRATERYNPIEAVSQALKQTWDVTILSFNMMGKLITGQANLQNVSGPITIAQVAGQTASLGIDQYLYFLALFSVSLGVLNLLPIPILDGGHLLFYFIEAVSGKPVPERIMIVGQQIGMVLLGGLMSLAFFNDITRLLG